MEQRKGVLLRLDAVGRRIKHASKGHPHRVRELQEREGFDVLRVERPESRRIDVLKKAREDGKEEEWERVRNGDVRKAPSKGSVVKRQDWIAETQQGSDRLIDVDASLSFDRVGFEIKKASPLHSQNSFDRSRIACSTHPNASTSSVTSNTEKASVEERGSSTIGTSRDQAEDNARSPKNKTTAFTW